MTKYKLAGFGHSHLSAYLRAYMQGSKAGNYPGLDMTFGRLGMDTFQPNFETVSTESAYGASATGNAPSRLKRLGARLKGGGYHSFDALDRPRVLTEALERRLTHMMRRDDPDAILLACMGNEYNTMGMLQHPEPFDFDLPGSGIPIEEGKTVIPYAMMRAQMTALCEQNVLLFWRFFNEAAEKPVFLTPPPPPIADKMHIMSYPGAFAGRAKQYGVSPVGLRRKMWLLYCDILRDVTKDTGTTFVELPDPAFVDGCLAKQFWQEDPTHGNVDYGRLMLEHVTDLAFGAGAAKGEGK